MTYIKKKSITVWTVCEGKMLDGRTVYVIFRNLIKQNSENKIQTSGPDKTA